MIDPDNILAGKLAGKGYILIANEAAFVELLLQTAGCVLSETETLPVTENTSPISGAAGILAKRLNRKPGDFQFFLESQIELLFSSIPAICEWPELQKILKREGAELIIKALTTYQKQKTLLIRNEQEVHGKNWGKATDFNKMNWTQRNRKLGKIFGIEQIKGE